jgi:GntR family transcriptional regulator
VARIPMYRMIEEDLLGQIERGELPRESQLPSETALAEQYGVSRMTVRQALDRLETARLVVRQQGSGSFVAGTSVRARRVNRLRSFSEELANGDVRVTSRVLGQEALLPPADVAARLGTDGKQATRLERVRLVDDDPAALQVAWIPVAVAPGLARADLSSASLYATLRDRFGVEFGWAEQVVRAVLLDEAVAGDLGVDAGRPAIETERTTYSSDNLPIEFVRSWTRAEFPLLMHLDTN